MTNSLWRSQAKDRVDDMADVMRTGQYPSSFPAPATRADNMICPVRVR
jgi:hypothetical protein